jgi:hypothetical protein
MEQEASDQGVFGKIRKLVLWLKKKVVKSEFKLPEIKYLPVIYQSER